MSRHYEKVYNSGYYRDTERQTFINDCEEVIYGFTSRVIYDYDKFLIAALQNAENS